MQQRTSTWLIISTIILVVVLLGAAVLYQRNAPGELDAFAECLKNKGATFYGAFWCPHCQNQKSLFGRSQRFLAYVECSTPDGQGQLDICKQKKIEGYPTWEFGDGSRESGEVQLQTLADKTGCELPEQWLTIPTPDAP